MTGVVTVAIPVLNGAAYLDEVLAAVRAQEVEREVELLSSTPGSTDGSLEIAERHGARVHEIPSREFSHGGTRNLMMELAQGRARRVPHAGRDAGRTSAGSPRCSRASSRPTTSLRSSARTIARPGRKPHDQGRDGAPLRELGHGRREIDVQRLDRSPAGLAAYRAEPGKLTFLSERQLLRRALRRGSGCPFRDVPYAEDQLLGRELIEAGYAKVFHPDAGSCTRIDFPPASVPAPVLRRVPRTA